MGLRSEIVPRALSPDLDPWEQQPGETNTAYGRFVEYRDQSPTRSLRRLARGANVSLQAISAQAKRESWTARVAAWDRYVRQVEDAEVVIARRSAAKRHAQLASSHLAALSLSTQELGRRVADNQELLREMPLEQLLRVEAAMARATPRLVVSERLALGMSTENVSVADQRDREIAQASDQDLDAALLSGGVGSPTDYLDGLEDGAAAAVAMRLAAEAAERAGAS